MCMCCVVLQMWECLCTIRILNNKHTQTHHPHHPHHIPPPTQEETSSNNLSRVSASNASHKSMELAGTNVQVMEAISLMEKHIRKSRLSSPLTEQLRGVLPSGEDDQGGMRKGDGDAIEREGQQLAFYLFYHIKGGDAFRYGGVGSGGVWWICANEGVVCVCVCMFAYCVCQYLQLPMHNPYTPPFHPYTPPSPPRTHHHPTPTQ